MKRYPLILNVVGWSQGFIISSPMGAQAGLLKSADIKDEAFADRVVQSVSRQKWVLKSSVIFYYSIVPYRGEWRYAFNAPRVMMIHAGHVTENLYLACSALDLGDLRHCGHGFRRPQRCSAWTERKNIFSTVRLLVPCQRKMRLRSRLFLCIFKRKINGKHADTKEKIL